MFYRLLRPLLFRFDPERAHHLVMGLTRALQHLPLDGLGARWGAHDPKLAQQLFGLDFPSPVGLAAGLDKNATHVRLWQQLGFGFVEVGSVTAQPAAGNPQPRLFRLPADRALINRMGLNNLGPARVLRNIAQIQHRLRVPLGINLAKTHDPAIMGVDAIEDFVASYTLLAPLASYVTLNVSCPNTTEGKTFEDPASLAALLQAISAVASKLTAPPPLLVKLSPPGRADWQPEQAFAAMCEVLLGHEVAGLIIANTAGPASVPALATSASRIEAIGKGGLSGRPLAAGALRMLRATYAATAGRVPLIGVGGVDSAESAYAMIKAGASLVQLYTGLIYQGPGLIRRINKGLIRLVDADGYGHLREAVGAEAG